MNTKITAHWFTYGGDSDVLPWSIKSFKSLFPEAKIVIIDDNNCPSPEKTKTECEKLKAEWRTSTYDRSRNLNGPDCILGILKEYKTSVDQGAEVIFKIDPDTIVLNKGWFEEFQASHKTLAGGNSRGYMYGCCYAIRATTAINVLNYFLENPPKLGSPEDAIISYAHSIIEGSDKFYQISQWLPEDDQKGNGPDGIITAWNWQAKQTKAMLGRYAKFSIITTGNLMSKGMDRCERAKIMKSLLTNKLR